ncbi:MAG: RNA-binding protein domain [candidate division NC10 bacterium]|nr:RNA-binding protein domain [candidate division NC10 bacterium]
MFKELVEFVAKALVEQPDQVHVETVEDPAATTLKLRVAPGDLGRVIGKQGRTARAIRTLLHATAAKAKRRVVLEIVE